ncbi:hypothetical protein AB9M75_04045 [Lactobacillus sp. AN1001]
MVKMADLKKVAREAYFRPNMTFGEDKVTGQDAMRNAIKDALGGKVNYYSWQENKNKVFEIISVAVDAITPTLLTDQFDQIADIRNASTNEKPLFKVNDPRMIRVGRIAAGSQDLRRQTITGKTFTIDTDWYGTEVYAEFEQFMAGDIDWNKLVDRVTEGFANHLQACMAEALTTAYTKLNASDKLSGKVTIDALVKLAQRIQVKSGAPVAIYGTKAALGKVAELAGVQLFSGTMKDEFNKIGYLGTVRGLELIEIPQAYKANTDEFALSDSDLLILPKGEKIIGVVMEGDSLTDTPDNMLRNDMQMSFVTLKKLGVQVMQMKVYGYANLG